MVQQQEGTTVHAQAVSKKGTQGETVVAQDIQY